MKLLLHSKSSEPRTLRSRRIDLPLVHHLSKEELINCSSGTVLREVQNCPSPFTEINQRIPKIISGGREEE